MSRVLLITTVVSAVLTIATIVINSQADVTVAPIHFWAGFLRSAAVTSWVLIGLVLCTERVLAAVADHWRKVDAKVDQAEQHLDTRLQVMQKRLNTVEDVIEDLDHERIQANAMVISIFKNRKTV